MVDIEYLKKSALKAFNFYEVRLKDLKLVDYPLISYKYIMNQVLV